MKKRYRVESAKARVLKDKRIILNTSERDKKKSYPSSSSAVSILSKVHQGNCLFLSLSDCSSIFYLKNNSFYSIYSRIEAVQKKGTKKENESH